MSHPRDAVAASAHTFDAWAAAGRGERMAAGHAELTAAAWQAVAGEEGLAGKTVLDVGCGVGLALLAGHELGASRLWGVDVSPGMVARANEHLRAAVGADDAVDVRVAEAATMPWPDASVQAAISIESLYYHPDPVASLREIVRLLAPGARFATAIELYADNAGTHAWVDAMPTPMKLWSAVRWVDAFRTAGFVDVTTDRVVRSEAPTPREAFKPSRFSPTYEDHLTYLREGALRVVGRRAG